MVIYYSATGNSRHAAFRIHEAFGGDLIDVCDHERPASFRLKDGETLFFATFNCFWGISARMEAFIRDSEFQNAGKIVAVITCGGYLGGADVLLKKLFLEKGLPKPIVYSLVMVTNYSVLHDVPPADVQKKKLLRAEKALDAIVRGGQKPYRSNWFIRSVTPGIHAQYEKVRATAPFCVDDTCVRCGLCVKDCPVHAMEMGAKTPFWAQPKCDHCLRCLHRCPVGVINYGDATRNRLRYTYPSGDIENS